MTRLVRWMVEHSLVVHLVSVFIVAVGIYGLTQINREAFPDVNLDIIQIDVNYPGATPTELERLVITPIEQELKALDGIDKMLSVSYPGSGRITLEVDPYASNRQRLASDVQLAVERARLPQDLPDDPVVTEIEGAVFPILRLAVAAHRTPVELKRLGDDIRDDLLAIPGVAKVVIQGARKAEIRVTVDPARLARERVSVGEIAAALAGWNVTAPGGELDTRSGQKQVRIAGEFTDARDAAAVVLRANELGQGIRLGDIARVSETLEKPRVLYDVSGETAVSLLVLKRADADIITTVDKVNAYLATVAARYGADVRVQTFQDFSRFARLRLGVLTNNAVVGLGLVFVTLLLFLRPSVALTTTWGLPIIFLGGLYTLYLAGITLNLLSMFGFIMVLGMLVDDAVVIGENITYHMERGLPPREAAVRGTREVMVPVAATVSTTIVAFLPLMFMGGIIGKFIFAIPVVVSLLLVLSWLESFLMLPSHVADVTRPHARLRERRWLARLEQAYAAALDAAVRHRWITTAISFSLLVGSLVLARAGMSFELFPAAGVDQFVVRVTAPPGTSVERLREQMLAVDRALRARIDARYLEATVIASGEIALDEGDPLTQRGGRFGQIRAVYTPAAARPAHDALDDMRRIARELPPLFPALELAVNEVKPGPRVGRALEAELSGADTAAVEAAARRLMALLKDVPGVLAVDSGLKPGDDELHVVLNRTLASYAGIDLATAARHVRAAVGGLVVGTTRRGTEEIDVTIRYPQDGVDEMQLLRELLVPNQRGGLVPLARIASFAEHPGVTAIRHKAGVRVVHVVADVDTAVLTSVALNRLVQARAAEWIGDSGVRVNYGGEQEKNVQSFRDLMVAMLFALLGIFFILAMQFNSLAYPVLVMLAIPFGVVGIILTFFLHDLLWRPMPLSFFSTLGMVALSGVVVNSSLLLLEFVRRAREQGMALHEAIVSAGRRRLRAIIITASTTVVGLLPTGYGWGGFDPFVAPMALALSWGLAFATLITLFTIPAALAAAVDVKTLARRLLRRG